MDTKVPLRSLLHQFNLYEHEYKLIRKELFESVFGGIMKENTPYKKILAYHPSTSEEEISTEQQICDKLNEHLKDSNSQLHLHLPVTNERITLSRQLLTLGTPVDLKPFALLIGCCLF